MAPLLVEGLKIVPLKRHKEQVHKHVIKETEMKHKDTTKQVFYPNENIRPSGLSYCGLTGPTLTLKAYGLWSNVYFENLTIHIKRCCGELACYLFVT